MRRTDRRPSRFWKGPYWTGHVLEGKPCLQILLFSLRKLVCRIQATVNYPDPQPLRRIKALVSFLRLKTGDP